MEMGVELELELELELGLLAAAPVHVPEAFHKSFIKPVHSSWVHKSIHKTFTTAIWVL